MDILVESNKKSGEINNDTEYLRCTVIKNRETGEISNKNRYVENVDYFESAFRQADLNRYVLKTPFGTIPAIDLSRSLIVCGLDSSDQCVDITSAECKRFHCYIYLDTNKKSDWKLLRFVTIHTLMAVKRIIENIASGDKEVLVFEPSAKALHSVELEGLAKGRVVVKKEGVYRIVGQRVKRKRIISI